ncbi:unnamed protein product [Mytilus coruscus]|uniref:Uncharacterized protein n=1 Tax=Mytilus coruscus TaxID=42192 RepID=A0A6J8BRX4_MYTCO|nr:unnamed protein product [Mytilus coruscus]
MMNENPEQKENKEEKKEVFSERSERSPFKKPKPKDPKRVAAGKKGAEVRIRNAELRKKEVEKLKKENSKIKQITKDSDTETDYESNEHIPSVKKHSGSKVDYKFALFSIGIGIACRSNKMASALAMMLGGAITNAFAFSGSNYLFSHMGSNANEEKIRHDKAIEKLEKKHKQIGIKKNTKD